MGVAGWRFAHTKKTLRVRDVIICVLEDPVVVAIGSPIMIDITRCKDWPQQGGVTTKALMTAGRHRPSDASRIR
ncbi:hypothetical protein GGD66_002970 [Bradyrhizobium sp. CIR48]|uniref:hypothetical protein n=1 Tax=Bradyrhizobium sp. CIR48 TaxID=2663840 RepID=UPI0016068EB0|nr:hypothetical protein [Bradyrhizobium sp. CIR48]MBB4424424.1 hypothetical protein [Bradyrhizobium sp. CIR48]